MGAPTRDIRNEAAKKLLDYGFANYSLSEFEEGSIGNIKVHGGDKEEINTYYPSKYMLVGKGEDKNIQKNVILPDFVNAPVNVGDKLGEITYTLNGNEIGKVDITAGESVNRISYFGILAKLLKNYLII